MTIAKTNRMQYFLMIPNLIFGKAIGITAGVMVREVGADTWLSMTIGFAAGLLIMLLMTYICSRFPDKTIIQISEELFGKWIARGTGIILALFFVILFGASANVMTLHVSEYFLTETPFFMICLLYTLLCMYGVFLGPEVVVRFSLLAFIMLFLITLAMVTGTLEDIDFLKLQPFLDNGIIPNIASSYYIFGDLAMPIMAVGFFYPMLNKKNKVMSITFWTIIVSACLVIIWPVFELMVMGPEVMKQYVVVCMQQIRNARLTKYLPRYELIMVSFFTFSVFIQSAAMFYCAKHSIKQITGIKKDWIIIVPITVVLLFVTYFMANDHNYYIQFLTFPYSQICAAISIGFPVILFFTALARGRLKKRKYASGLKAEA